MRMKPFVQGLSIGDWTSYYNGKYQVQVRTEQDTQGRGIVVLSIRREDRKAIMDWRDMQWIKNQLLGPEVEAVQLFPAESRLVDTANQYYLTAYAEPGYRFPFGFVKRAVSSDRIRVVNPDGGKSNQREFAPHVRPPDLEEQEEDVVRMLKAVGARVVL